MKEHISPEEAVRQGFEPVSPGFTWGETWEYCWFRGSIVLPEQAQGKRIVMNVEPGGESTLFVNGKSFGTYRSEQVAPLQEKHHFIEDNILTDCGKPGQRYEILMETYAGHYYLDLGACATGPVISGLYEDSLKEGARRVLGRSTYGIWHEDAYQLYMDVETLARLLTVLDETSLRAAKVAEALERFTLTVEFEQDREVKDCVLPQGQGRTAPCAGSGKREYHAGVLCGGECPYRSGLAVAHGGDTPQDSPHLCRAAAPDGTVP